MPKKQPIEYLRHIADECAYITSVITPTLEKSNFLFDETLKRAVVRSLEIIGEASKQIPADIKYTWNDIKWKHIAGMRDKLIHDYMGIDYGIVWDVVKNEIPHLHIQIQQVIDREKT